MANSQKILKYTVIIEPAQEGGYVAFVPALPGCATQGESFEEVKAMIIDAIKGYLEVLVEDGEEIPRESEETIETHVSIPLTASLLRYDKSR